jgi:AmmeMemoRadiSam system protein B/AmmeMemoRadiSam system protein A
MMAAAVPRPAVVAGLFYPHEPGALRAEVARYLESARPPASVDESALTPKMLIVPHAGYVYSGPVAAHAYARLRAASGRITRVILLGPAHRVALRGLALPSAPAFETPLGAVPVDAAAAAVLDGLPQVRVDDAAHDREHSLEVQLPFLQRVLDPGFGVVPLVVGAAAVEDVAEVVLRLWGGDETLIVISSDLSHYLPHATAQRIDDATVQRILGFDAHIDHHEACGATPINGALLAARHHELAARLLDLRNSGDTAGDRARVVGYCAIEFTAQPGLQRQAEGGDSIADAGVESTLGPALLARARNAIAARLGRPAAPELDHPRLSAPGATFVTLRRDGQLRGCVGRLRATRPLDVDVRRNAVAAAFEDYRCPPCRADEFDQLEIEVSLIGAEEPLRNRSEASVLRTLRPGIDGVVLRWRDHQSTLLPQVWQALPERAEFLAALKRKAGLPADFWTPEMQFSSYQVSSFTEPRGDRR